MSASSIRIAMILLFTTLPKADWSLEGKHPWKAMQSRVGFFKLKGCNHAIPIVDWRALFF